MRKVDATILIEQELEIPVVVSVYCYRCGKMFEIKETETDDINFSIHVEPHICR